MKKLLIVSALSSLMVACGGGDSSPAPSSSQTTTPSSGQAPTKQVAISIPTYSDVAISEGNAAGIATSLRDFLEGYAYDLYLNLNVNEANPSKFEVFNQRRIDYSSELCSRGGSMVATFTGDSYLENSFLRIPAGVSE